jgi:hypothetical protein
MRQKAWTSILRAINALFGEIAVRGFVPKAKAKNDLEAID